jgi:hypothetical protein
MSAADLNTPLGRSVQRPMYIDRERFLVLVASLATGAILVPACDPVGTPPVAPSQPVEAQVVPVATPTTPTPEPALPPLPAATATATPRDSNEDAPTPASTSPDPYKGTPVRAQSCDPALNMRGGAVACRISPPGPTCESIHDTKTECPTLNGLLKPRVAATAIDCLNRKSGTKEICEFNVSSICAYEALGSACLDPAAKAVCNNVVARCGPPKGHYSKMTRESCEAGVSAISEGKRKKFISCITEFCRFETCLTTL